MLLTAQPLHAFDLDKVPEGALIVRTAADGEKMTTLDGVERTFDSQTVLCATGTGLGNRRDHGRRGLGGLGLDDARTARGRDLERRQHPSNFTQARPALGGVEPVREAAPSRAGDAGAADRIEADGRGLRRTAGSGDDRRGGRDPAAASVRMRTARADSLLGMSIEPELSVTYLERLGFGVEREDGELTAEVPVHRHYDVTREADLIEEVGRIHGYDAHLPATLPEATGQGGRLTREQSLRRRAEDVMRDLGFDALVSLTLTDPGPRRGCGSRRRAPRPPITVSNPLSVEHSALRTTVLGSLLGAARYNLARGAERVALFESGRAYLAEGHLGGGRRPGGRVQRRPRHAGIRAASDRGARGRPARSGELEGRRAGGRLLRGEGRARGARRAARRRARLRARAAAVPPSGPRRQGDDRRTRRRMARRGASAGVPRMGPRVRDGVRGRARGVAASSYGAEAFEDVITYPATYQDLAIVVPEDVPAERVREAVEAGGGGALRSASVFDLYRGEQVGADRKSIAMRLQFRAPDRTLTDEEVAERRAAITEALSEIGGRCVSDPSDSGERTTQPLDGEPVARVLVAGASGFTGALASQIVWRHPRLELARDGARRRGDTARPPVSALPRPARARGAEPGCAG